MADRTEDNHSKKKKSSAKSGSAGKASSKRSSSKKAASREAAAEKGRGNGKRKKKGRKRKLIAVLAVEVVLILVLCVGVWGLSKLDQIQDLGVEAGEVSVNEDLDETTIEVMEGYTNIALFGIDTRTIGDLGAGNRSDTIIIASINNDTKEVRMLSVYRDTYLNRADDTYGKCNAAYSAGGPKQALEMLNTNLDLNIQYYVSIDFAALIKTIDALGGIEIDVQEDEWEYVNDYMYETTEIAEDYLDHYSEFLTGPGLQTLDGLQATAYCRIRYTSGDDFKRTERQRTVITLIAEKAKEAGLATITEIIDEVFPLVATNIPKATMVSMAASLMSYEMGENDGFPFDLLSTTVNSASVVVPADLESNVIQLHEFLFDETDYYPSSTVIKISDEIISRTGVTADDAT